MVEGRSRKSPGRQRERELEVAIKAKQTEVTQLRRKVGWLMSEIARRKGNSRPTVQQHRSLAQDVWSANTAPNGDPSGETQRGLEGTDAPAASDEGFDLLNEQYRCLGPKCLEERGTPWNNSILPDVDQMTEYWTGVIGVPGTYDLENPAIKRW